MKKLLISLGILSSLAIVAPAAAEAKTASNAVNAPQIRVQIGDRNRRGARSYTTTRIVGYGRNRYRETVRITYLPNGRRIVRVISRQRIGWGNGNGYRRG